MADSSTTQLSPRGAIIVGLIFIAVGSLVACGALGVGIHLPLSKGVPVWVGVAVGLLFAFGGAAVILGYAIAGVELDDPDAEAGRYQIHVPFTVRLLQYIVGLVVYGLFAAVFGWVAFGKGERQFSTTVTVPWLVRHGVGNEWVGRALFGLVAVVAVAGGVAIAVRNFKSLRG